MGGQKLFGVNKCWPPLQDICADKFSLLSLGGWAEGLAYADQGARTTIGASGFFSKYNLMILFVVAILDLFLVKIWSKICWVEINVFHLYFLKVQKRGHTSNQKRTAISFWPMVLWRSRFICHIDCWYEKPILETEFQKFKIFTVWW